MKRTPIADILWLFLGTRLLLVVCTYFSYILFPVPPHVYPSTPVNLPGLLTSWGNWDAARFVSIAQYGYLYPSDQHTPIFNTPFFPLMPLLIRGVAFLFGNQFYLAAGMLVSNAALLGALFVLYQLAEEALGPLAGRRTLLYLCLFPTAFFFFAAYNEALFVLLTCATFLALRRQRWWLAGLLGLLAALTRTAGALLVFPFLYEVWVSRTGRGDGEEKADGEAPTSGFWRWLWAFCARAWPVVLIPLGTLAYCWYCWRLFGDPLAFAVVQTRWARVTTWPWVGLVSALVGIFHTQPFGSFTEAHLVLDTTVTLLAIALAVLSWRLLRGSYALWTSLLVLFMLISPALTQADTLQSNQRFILEMFPAFLVLADLGIKHPRLHTICVVTFPFLQAIMAALFVLNRWMV